jgi:hypothetical protein
VALVPVQRDVQEQEQVQREAQQGAASRRQIQP